LAAVAAYAAWSRDHDRAGRQTTNGSHEAVMHGDSPTDRLGGKP